MLRRRLSPIYQKLWDDPGEALTGKPPCAAYSPLASFKGGKILFVAVTVEKKQYLDLWETSSDRFRSRLGLPNEPGLAWGSLRSDTTDHLGAMSRVWRAEFSQPMSVIGHSGLFRSPRKMSAFRVKADTPHPRSNVC
jgi:hypothetical protein